ncbi:SDR family NAD(P)-dependent oxidoreductase [Halomonas eurihalina]|uniref:SDR family NAD(P)-dependent oxidoreductase n=1 Tax=Halomonas eurihalina TaxID=42566 RepID=A0A5D9DDG3_HALER|nr:SDR family NAD(P)-dependent oxidoreductase [Halomonas eurihalina]MDR5858501.1 SDR family NAD(P)-dependent oxidoreductase [Halomonas eurihalina]TZG40695.1 SDR family NAD(P)-dependent oxidoreductase [Halomonas eurihalina]
MTAPRSLLITGATGAIGSALARHYALPGVRLVLHGRRRERLEALADECRQAGAEVETSRVELTDDAALTQWLEQLTLPDVIIANAGQNTHAEPGREMEDWSATSQLLTINLRTPMAMAERLAPRMVERGHGQLVFISSLAAWHGLPLTPSYSASKAGIKAYGEALRGWLASRGVGVTVIMPGYVSSPMCESMPGPKPWEIDATRAARRIARGIERNRARVSFPFPLNLGCWSLAVLPAALSQRLLGLMGYGRPS